MTQAPAPPSPSVNYPDTLGKTRAIHGGAGALGFCKECLGWSDASLVSTLRALHVVENRQRPGLQHPYGEARGFQLNPAILAMC